MRGYQNTYQCISNICGEILGRLVDWGKHAAKKDAGFHGKSFNAVGLRAENPAVTQPTHVGKKTRGFKVNLLMQLV